jgi:adenosyl cobinamide kinase/adenosyl cobinamide phosphate guanylyltransferase
MKAVRDDGVPTCPAVGITTLSTGHGQDVIPELPHIALILGGARSGKSRHAEALLARLRPPWVYVATAGILDDEMRARVAEHQARRGAEWRTIEAPIDLPGALDAASGRPVLIDCLTLWLTNLMLGGHDIAAATVDFERALARRTDRTVLVSNEVGLGIVPATPLGRSFRDAAGRLNQRIAALAGGVEFMISGLPLKLK